MRKTVLLAATLSLASCATAPPMECYEIQNRIDRLKSNSAKRVVWDGGIVGADGRDRLRLESLLCRRLPLSNFEWVAD